ncbi:MAG: hypothetical protein HYV97_03130 [Bdellovibrio sp.]|nr:hypothetical protein [Bdellovibrio sp.]
MMIPAIFIRRLLLCSLFVGFMQTPALSDDQATQLERLFKNKLLTLWPSALSIEKLSPKLFNHGIALTRPPLTWSPILRVTGLDLNGKGYTHCLYYLIPHHSDSEALEQPGLLKIVDVGVEENCNDKFVRHSFAFLSGVDQLQIYLTYPGSMDNLGKDMIANHFILKFFYQGRAVEWAIPVYNVPTGFLKHSTTPRRLHQWDLRGVYTQAERYRPGVQLGPLIENGRKIDAKIIWYGGQIDKVESMCRVVNDQCQVIGEDICHRCAVFSQSANAYGCSSTFHRVCGSGRCGEKEAPACPRGHHYLSTDVDKSGAPIGLIEGACTAGFKSGICRSGLKPFCNEHGVQVCL